MKRTIFTLLMVLVLAMGTAVMAQQPADQSVDQTGQPETGTGPDIDVDTGAQAEGAVDVDVSSTTDADTAAQGDDTVGDMDTTDTADLPATGSEMPLVGLLGLLALAGAFAFRAIR